MPAAADGPKARMGVRFLPGVLMAKRPASRLPLLAALAAAANHAPPPTGMAGPPAPSGIGAMAGQPGPGGMPMPAPTPPQAVPPPAASVHDFAGRPARKVAKRK